MTLVQADRIAAQVGFDWATLPTLHKSIADVRADAVELRLYRERSSHRGVCRLQRLQRLWAYSVNQSYLDGSLQALHSLTGLKVLKCASRFAEGEIKRLREALPNTRCQWFDMLAEYGTIDAGVKAAVSRMIGESDS